MSDIFSIMRKNFWEKLNNNFTVLAPMAGITDSAFRQVCVKYGADVLYSEMASTTALVYAPKKTLDLLKFSKKERPYVVQLFGSNPEHFAKAVKIVEKKIKPDGIDINFGCPVPKVAKQGAGAELFKNLKLSREVIEATINNTSLPVSIKTRARSGKINVLEFLKNIEDLDIKALMIHGRSVKEGFKGPIDTEIIKNARKYFKGVIIANGGIYNREDAKMVFKKTGVDGIAIGQGAMGRPWVFDQVKSRKLKVKSKEDIFKVAIRHAKLTEKLKGERGIIEMRKHLCWYVQDMPNAKKMRGELVRIETIGDIKRIFNKF